MDCFGCGIPVLFSTRTAHQIRPPDPHTRAPTAHRHEGPTASRLPDPKSRILYTEMPRILYTSRSHCRLGHFQLSSFWDSQPSFAFLSVRPPLYPSDWRDLVCIIQRSAEAGARGESRGEIGIRALLGPGTPTHPPPKHPPTRMEDPTPNPPTDQCIPTHTQR